MVQTNMIDGMLHVFADGEQAFRWSFGRQGATSASLGGWLQDHRDLAQFMQELAIPDYRVPGPENQIQMLVKVDEAIINRWANR